MEWFSFSHTRRDRRAPAFRLPSSLGRPVALSDYHERGNLVLIFLPGMDAGYRSALWNLAADLGEYEHWAARVLVILSGPDATSALKDAGSYPFPVLADREGTVRQAYAALLPVPPGEKPIVFVLDRYGGPYAALAPADLDDPDLRKEILRWLTFIEIQCPECGAPEWPVEI